MHFCFLSLHFRNPYHSLDCFAKPRSSTLVRHYLMRWALSSARGSREYRMNCEVQNRWTESYEDIGYIVLRPVKRKIYIYIYIWSPPPQAPPPDVFGEI